ncbi:MAG: imidazoleglycerol-phosphate dehydratase HisB [Leptospiraceae bacterium]|nr:imidazoleglycerol-phosphate dehydratase HisB [Leptospiraceae bacterium]MDW8307619.1 imidazoleglycerol-phosphate dehydratase HisB [Leptospiraceae bacterium]
MRMAQTERKTRETSISLKLNVDGEGELKGEIPIPFFAHMLSHLAKYSLFDMEFHITGDLEIDAHHTVEDTAIVLGETLRKALGNKAGIQRYGHFTLPMDEVLTTVAIDFSGRPYFHYQGPALMPMGKFGIYDSELTHEFLHKLSIHAAMNLHVVVHYGQNRHHIHESIFKALGHSLRQAVALDPRRGGDIPSTKGIL